MKVLLSPRLELANIRDAGQIKIWISGVTKSLMLDIASAKGFPRLERHFEDPPTDIVLDPYLVRLFRQQGGTFDPKYAPLSMEESAVLNNFIMHAERSFETYERSVQWLFELNPENIKHGLDRRLWARQMSSKLLPECAAYTVHLIGDDEDWQTMLGAVGTPEFRRMCDLIRTEVFSMRESV